MLKPADSGRDDGQTNSVLFHLSVWPSTAILSQRTADVTTDRRILFFFTYLSVERRSEPAESGRVDDEQTNSVLFHLSVRRARF